jgi:hypothetical protein
MVLLLRFVVLQSNMLPAHCKPLLPPNTLELPPSACIRPLLLLLLLWLPHIHTPAYPVELPH